MVFRKFVRARHGTILCFHGVDPVESATGASPHLPIVKLKALIEAARVVAEPVALRELIERHTARRSTAGLFSITFDDAYASIGPIVRDIAAAGVPSTLFAVTGHSRTGEPFWWDRVETLHRFASPDYWAKFEQAIGLPEAYRTALAASFGPLRPLRQWILHLHAGRWPAHLEDTLNEFEACVRARAIQHPMRLSEIDELVRTGYVDVGTHTVTHPALPALADEAIRKEVGASHRQLQECWRSTMGWLAAPYGLYDARTARIVRELGLSGILTLRATNLAHTSPDHGLPRVNLTARVPPWKMTLRVTRLFDVIAALRGGTLTYPPLPGPD